jgi:hypothetical protein
VREMAKRLGCAKCSAYRYDVRRCGFGKINPTTIKGGVDAAKFMGINYICDVDGMRKKVSLAIAKEIVK